MATAHLQLQLTMCTVHGCSQQAEHPSPFCQATSARVVERPKMLDCPPLKRLCPGQPRIKHGTSQTPPHSTAHTAGQRTGVDGGYRVHALEVELGGSWSVPAPVPGQVLGVRLVQQVDQHHGGCLGVAVGQRLHQAGPLHRPLCQCGRASLCRGGVALLHIWFSGGQLGL